MIPSPPNDVEIRAAVEGGARVAFGLPTHVMLADGWAALDLTAAQRGDPNPWMVCRRRAGVAFLGSAFDRGIRLGDLDVPPPDWGHVDNAIAAAPLDDDRHCPEGEARRLRAGEHAMRVTDAMVRARLLDAVDGWSAVLGDLVDEDPAHGRLHKPRDASVLCLLLRVVCPSTGRAYVHRVPADRTTAKSARAWIMLDWFPDGAPEVET